MKHFLGLVLVLACVQYVLGLTCYKCSEGGSPSSNCPTPECPSEYKACASARWVKDGTPNYMRSCYKPALAPAFESWCADKGYTDCKVEVCTSGNNCNTHDLII